MSRLTPFGFLFTKSLTDLVHGIRRCQDENSLNAYLKTVLSECREEARSADISIKSLAILKLAYLEMLGVDMSFANFHVIEVMASPHFQQKRVGYMAATQSFRSDDELLLLITNLLKTDLISKQIAIVGIALSGLSTFLSKQLAEEIKDDILKMLTHSNKYIRKKAILSIKSVVEQCPEILPDVLKRFGSLLESSDLNNIEDVSVVSSIVVVINEMLNFLNGADFLELTPQLYDLFTKSEHNWTLLKLLKIFAQLCIVEPRLKTKLFPAVKTMLDKKEQPALVYEALLCILNGDMLNLDDFEGIALFHKTLNLLFKNNDANLKFLASKLLVKLSSISSSLLPDELVFNLIKNADLNKQTRKMVLKLCRTIVNADNLFEVVSELVLQFRTSNDFNTKVDIAHAVCAMVRMENYTYVPNFDWLCEVLNELTLVVADDVLAELVLDLALKVRDVDFRAQLCGVCFNWLTLDLKGTSNFVDCCWFVLGEYSDLEVFNLVKNEGKVVVLTVAKLVLKKPQFVDLGIQVLERFSFSMDFEVQERACQFLEFFKLAKDSPNTSDLIKNGLQVVFEGELQPVALNAQSKVECLVDLDTPINVGEIKHLSLELSDEEVEEVAVSEPVKEEVTQVVQEQRQLFNLNHLSNLKPEKKKVTIVGEALPPVRVKRGVRANKS